MSGPVTDLTQHPDFELAVAPLRAEIKRLSEINEREHSACREQLATATAELQSLAADKIALNAQLDEISQQNEENEIQLKNYDELGNLVQQLTRLHYSGAELQRLRAEYEDLKKEHAEDLEKGDIVRQNLRGLQAKYQATVAELKQLRESSENADILRQRLRELQSTHQATVAELKQLRESSNQRKTSNTQKTTTDKWVKDVEVAMQNLRELNGTHLATVAELQQLRNVYDTQQLNYAEEQRKSDARLQHLRTLQARYHDVLDELQDLRDDDY